MNTSTHAHTLTHGQRAASLGERANSSSFRFLLRCVPIPTVQIQIGLKCLWHKLWRLWTICTQARRMRFAAAAAEWSRLYAVLGYGDRTDECRHVCCTHKYHLCFCFRPHTHTHNLATVDAWATSDDVNRTHSHTAKSDRTKRSEGDSTKLNRRYERGHECTHNTFSIWSVFSVLFRRCLSLFLVSFILCSVLHDILLFVAMRTHFTRWNHKNEQKKTEKWEIKMCECNACTSFTRSVHERTFIYV